jgi:hypothetical protein
MNAARVRASEVGAFEWILLAPDIVKQSRRNNP